jgi:hypothetical protein
MAFGFPPRFIERRTFNLAADELQAVVKSVLQSSGWSYQVSANEFRAQVPISGWSWGEELSAKILPNGVIQVESKCKGVWPQIIDWGKNRSNVEIFFAQIQHTVAQGLDQTPEIARPQWPQKSSRAGATFFGCCLALFLLGGLLYAIAAVIGLLTGNLFLSGRGHGVTLHGPEARILSALILLGFGWFVLTVLRKRKSKSES